MNSSPEQPKIYNHKELEFLREFGCDLTEDAKAGKLKSVVGRSEEIQTMIETLCRSTKSNPVLVGDAGVGKTALVEGLAIMIANEEVPAKLRGCRLFSVSVSSLIAGSTWYGMIEARVGNLLAEAKQAKVIVFIDEIHTIIGSAPGEDTTRDVGQQLKPALARGEIMLIGATTSDEYRRFVESDEALERRFQPIRVPELSIKETFMILKSVAENHSNNNIEINENVLRLILSYSERFMPNRYFPDKAIDLLEQSVAFAELAQKDSVSAQDAKKVVQRIVGMPVNSKDSLLNLREKLNRNLILDDDQITQLCNHLNISIQGVNISPQRPNAVVFMLGESAQHASTFAEIISEELYNGENRVVKLNFSEITERWELERMLGIESNSNRRGQNSHSPVAKISQTPWCVLLCEGIENCSSTVQDIWSTAIENGYLIDSNKKKIYLSNSIVVMSAQVDISEKITMGFGKFDDSSRSTSTRNDDNLDRYFSKSLLSFTDLIVINDPANNLDTRRRWLKKTLHDNLTVRFKQQGIYIHWDKSVVENLIQKFAESNDEQMWEATVNSQILPELLPFIEEDGQQFSLKVIYLNDKVIVESEVLDDNAAELAKHEELLKKQLFKDLVNWSKTHYQVEKDEDFSTLRIHDQTMTIDLYLSFWKDQPLISLLTRVAVNVHADKDLLLYLLTKNMGLRFGKFAFENDGTVWFEYSLLGENCTRKGLIQLLQTFNRNARRYQKEIKQSESELITSKWLSDDAASWLDSHKMKKRK